MYVFVTGAAGFIGYHVCQRLLADGHLVVGLDNLNEYYDVSLKKSRLALLEAHKNFSFYRQNIADASGLRNIFNQHACRQVVHLAAQAGVRYSITNPDAYTESNLVGFANILELCRENEVEHLVFASSSSVYGGSRNVPFLETDVADKPVSYYAATKKANELMAHSYSHLYDIPITGLRFFTAYGPWGRPDMAYFKFADAIRYGKNIDLYNNGDMSRDFTYIDDIVEGLVRVLGCPHPIGDLDAPYQIFNIGNNKPVKLLDFVDILFDALAIETETKRELLPMQPGDVEVTFANVDKLYNLVGYKPSTSLKDGLRKFADWYKGYYSL